MVTSIADFRVGGKAGPAVSARRAGGISRARRGGSITGIASVPTARGAGGADLLCVTAADLLRDLGGRETTRTLERRLRHYVEPRLLCIDELGCLTYHNRAADLLFQVVSRRYERRSILVTTNLAFKDWGSIFPNAACATALLDRLTHHAEIIAITGESYRRREAEAAQTARRGKA